MNLRIRSFWLRPYGLSDENSRRISASLYGNAHLQELHVRLTGNHGRQGGEAIRDLLLVNRNIKYLDIFNCGLGPEGAACLAEALRDHQSALKRLELW